MFTVNHDTAASVLTIRISGRFDFSGHDEFRKIYESLADIPEKILIDFEEATYLDSSALGMLLMLRDWAGTETARVRIINSSSSVRGILAMANFAELFEID